MKPPCDCTSYCGDDPDPRKNLCHGCENYLDRTEPARILISGLQEQASQMIANANYLEQLHPQLNYHQQLRGAAQITRDWVTKLKEAS
ncbi:MAG TPA: hypothetical protein VLF09_03000 [Cellvibrio sp.]|nr:hypothetical protein [Cellvibrio sp.]